MSSSDAMSESSAVDSPQAFKDSPYNSPSQQVPQLAHDLTELKCAENMDTNANEGNTAFLRIVEQPQDYFRFRYKSEMVGTHGCLLGKSYTAAKPHGGQGSPYKHPTVELVNYTGRALIRCRLAQFNNPDEHPHKLLEDDQEDHDVSTKVPAKGSYRVVFPGMGIIHTAKKDVPSLLYNKYMEGLKNSNVNIRELRAYCDNMAKNIDLNIVRLRFSAHDIETDREICEAVYSEPIHNRKSAATNDLKICRISRTSGRPGGSDDVFLLVEKVNKKNINIRFFELAKDGREVWSDNGYFLQIDVHHQYAIVFKTPPYKDRKITEDVKVYMELVRPSDGRKSDPKEFVYKAEQLYRQTKKRKNNSYSSFDSSSADSIKSYSELPVPVADIAIQANNNNDVDMDDVLRASKPILPQTGNDIDLGQVLFMNAAEAGPRQTFTRSAMFSQPNVPVAPGVTADATQISIERNLNSSELRQLLDDGNGTGHEKKSFFDINLTDYIKTYDEIDMFLDPSDIVPDSGRGKVNLSTPSLSQDTKSQPDIANNSQLINEYSACYKADDGEEVKKLVKELCEMIREKTYKEETVRKKLERLLEIRLSNGDTFLHMTLCNNQQSLEYIVKLIHAVNMPHLLNFKNNLGQTILHLAVINDLPRIVTFLLSKGCDPMEQDYEGNNAVHCAVMLKSCLLPLLSGIKTYQIPCDLNAYNNEKQTALHLAAIYRLSSYARLLLQHGASYNAPDRDGRTPLHLAAYIDCLPVVNTLLEFVVAADIDALDGRGNTALQIVCNSRQRKNTLEIVKSLLTKNADPLAHEEHNESAWIQARDKPKIKEIMKAYVSPNMCDDQIKSEPEDDFESADEGDSQQEWQEWRQGTPSLQELPLYAGEVSRELDRSGAWRELAARLHHDALLNWYQNTPSPTRTLLNQLKECEENFTSKSLAMILEDMGQTEAANFIRQYICD